MRVSGVCWIVLVFFGCQFQASCGKKLHMGRAQDFVSSALEALSGQRPDSVTCPGSVKIEASTTFECTARFGDIEATAVVRQDDDQGNVSLVASRGILFANAAEEMIAKGIGERANVHATADCGARVRAAVPGETFTCQVKDARGTSGSVEVSVKDTDGNVQWRLVSSQR